MNATENTVTGRTIIDVGTPVEIPSAAPITVKAAAVAAALCIEEMAFGYKSDDENALREADQTLSAYRKIMESQGWELRGILALSNGAKGWLLQPR